MEFLMIIIRIESNDGPQPATISILVLYSISNIFWQQNYLLKLLAGKFVTKVKVISLFLYLPQIPILLLFGCEQCLFVGDILHFTHTIRVISWLQYTTAMYIGRLWLLKTLDNVVKRDFQGLSNKNYQRNSGGTLRQKLTLLTFNIWHSTNGPMDQ